ncbi:phage tail protein [Bifidobacterium sp. 82T10]|uniref:Phage tail protein n=2 Tax=Bifidobacterium miconis TaxID=2834435 RepID=A0ABS6WGD0_9BIFI|nr:phage tail protein [Bifidobacterium miconis]
MVFDRWGNPLGDLPYVIKAVRTRATDGIDTLDVTTIGEINKDERIVFKDSMGRWTEYVCQSTQTTRAAGMPVTVAYCAGSIAELSRTYIEDKRNRNTNAKACLAKALEDTRWTVGTVETGTLIGMADLAFYHCSVLDAIQKITETYGLETLVEYQPDPAGNRIDQRIIHLVEHRGQTQSTKRFEYGKDLTQIKREINADDVITRLYGYGKGVEQTNDQGEATGGYGRKITFSDVNNGKPYVQDDNALADWGIVGADGAKRHSEASVDFPNCEDPKELLVLTKAELRKRATPTVSYTADVTTLGQAGYDAEGTDVGDGVQIIDTSFTQPLRLEGRVLQIEEDLAGSLTDTKITLGNIRQSYTQRMAAQQQALDKLVSSSGAWNSAAAGSGPYIGDLINRVNEIMNATGGYTYLVPGQGIYVYDKPRDQNPTQCIQIGGGYWRIADSKKANGDWDFRSLASGKGIFADTLFTGRLADAAGLNYIDLDTGEVSFAARALVGGKTVQQYADQTLSDANSYAETKASDALAAAKAQSKSDSDAAKAAAQAYVDALDESLGQRSIFDRLTNNGATQGIYLQGGLLYLNATYMKTGVLDAALVKTGRLTDKKGLNYIDLDTGEIGLSSQTSIGEDTTLGDLSTKSYAEQLKQEAQEWAQDQAAAGDKATLDSAKADATAKADQAEANANAHSDAADKTTLASSKSYSDDGDKTTLAAAKAFATDESKSAVDTFEGELTQTYIFNKLTNNGQSQGIYLTGGNLYINATYIDTGILKGGNTYFNLDTGKLYMQDGEIVSSTIRTSKIIGASQDSYFMSEDGDTWLKFGQYTSIRNEISSSDAFGLQAKSQNAALQLAKNYMQLLVEASGNSSRVDMNANYAALVSQGHRVQLTSGATNLYHSGDSYVNLTDSRIDLYISDGAGSGSRMVAKSADSLQLMSYAQDVRLDLNDRYVAMVAGSYYVMVHKTAGVNTVTRTAAASQASTAVLESRMVALAADNVDLDSPDAYDAAPAGIEELNTGQLHDVLRLLADGDTEGAKALLDRYESEQRIWTQKDYDQANMPTPAIQ